jgi:hypothetical protein
MIKVGDIYSRKSDPTSLVRVVYSGHKYVSYVYCDDPIEGFGMPERLFMEQFKLEKSTFKEEFDIGLMGMQHALQRWCLGRVKSIELDCKDNALRELSKDMGQLHQLNIGFSDQYSYYGIIFK